MAMVGRETASDWISLLQEGGIVIPRFLPHFLPVPVLYEGLVQKCKITHRRHSLAADSYMEFATIMNVKWRESGSVH